MRINYVEIIIPATIYIFPSVWNEFDVRNFFLL